jgi:hypothetical protein
MMEARWKQMFPTEMHVVVMSLGIFLAAWFLREYIPVTLTVLAIVVLVGIMRIGYIVVRDRKNWNWNWRVV